ncbi:hypothetical protein ALC56_05436, partial [Trachymyrmex septentrionalis]
LDRIKSSPIMFVSYGETTVRRPNRYCCKKRKEKAKIDSFKKAECRPFASFIEWRPQTCER